MSFQDYLVHDGNPISMDGNVNLTAGADIIHPMYDT